MHKNDFTDQFLTKTQTNENEVYKFKLLDVLYKKQQQQKEEEKVHSGTFCFQVHTFICVSWAVTVLHVYHEYTAETESFAAICRDERS